MLVQTELAKSLKHEVDILSPEKMRRLQSENQQQQLLQQQQEEIAYSIRISVLRRPSFLLMRLACRRLGNCILEIEEGHKVAIKMLQQQQAAEIFDLRVCVLSSGGDASVYRAKCDV
jgi:hypothetical protein